MTFTAQDPDNPYGPHLVSEDEAISAIHRSHLRVKRTGEAQDVERFEREVYDFLQRCPRGAQTKLAERLKLSTTTVRAIHARVKKARVAAA